MHNAFIVQDTEIPNLQCKTNREIDTNQSDTEIDRESEQTGYVVINIQLDDTVAKIMMMMTEMITSVKVISALLSE